MMGLVELVAGEVGLTVAVLALIGYTVYENRVGTVAQTQERLKALAVATYRVAQETDGVDEDAVREEVNENWGEDEVFPSDFDPEKEPPTIGGDGD